MMLFVKKGCILYFIYFVLLNTIATAAPQVTQTQQILPNTQVIDQTGKSLKFYDDLLKDKIVAINFVFTRCTMTCPIAGFQFGRLRSLLGARAGRDVQLISVSMDAAYDTPARLKSWASKFNSGVGWTQVTGEKQNIDQLLKSLNAFSANKQDHSTLILIGNDKVNAWKWIDGASDPQVILAALSEWSLQKRNEAQPQN